jgi:heme exporter protein C
LTTDRAGRRVLALGSITTVLMVLAIVGLFLIAPEDGVQGQVQRIFYFHVSVAIISMVAFAVACVAGVMYLRRPREWWDDLGYITVRVGLMFAVMTVITGSIWAKGQWGTWWVWSDPRLATYTIVILLYAAYFVLRSSAEGSRQARFSAVYAIVAFASVPVSFYAVRIAQSYVHPVVFTSSGARMPNSMLLWFTVSFVGLMFLFATLVQFELLQHRAERALREAKLRLERG